MRPGRRGSIFSGLEVRVGLKAAGCITEREPDLPLSLSHCCRDKRRLPPPHRSILTGQPTKKKKNYLFVQPIDATAMYVSGTTTARQTDRQRRAGSILKTVEPLGAALEVHKN